MKSVTATSKKHCKQAEAPVDLAIEKQLCIALYQASHRTARFYGRMLEAHGLTFPRFLVLLALQGGGQFTVGALCTALDLDTSTITAVLKRLEVDGFVHRFRDLADERRVFIVLTAKGQAFKSEALLITARFDEAIGLPPMEANALCRALQGLSAALEPDGS